jgi:hypothetical protein
MNTEETQAALDDTLHLIVYAADHGRGVALTPDHTALLARLLCDDRLAIIAVEELRQMLRRAVEAGATVADDDSVIVEQILRDHFDDLDDRQETQS